MLATTCSSCGEKLRNPVEVDENISTFCHNCFEKSKNGQKYSHEPKHHYSKKNLRAWQ